MFSKTVICCFLALYTYISLAVATKHDRHHQRASGEIVSIPRNKNAIYVRDGYRARLRVFAKFNWQMLPRDLVPREQDFPFNPAASSMGAPIYQILDPKHNTILHNEETIAAVSKITKQSGSVRTVPEPYHAEYLTPVSIGTPPQVLHMDFDTGSSDFWMFSTLQPDNETSGHDAVFRPGKSSTYKNITGSTWKILYGDGSGATGIAGTDRVKVGGVTVQTQAIELAQGVSDSFVKDTNNDGLAGLGFSNINNVKPTRQKTIFDNLRPTLTRPIFTVNLREDGTGTFDFGFVNSSHIPVGRTLARIPINPSQGFWQFPSRAFAVDGNVTHRADIAAIGGTATPALADTGTSLLIVDPVVAWSYYRTVPGSGYSYYYGGYIFPCTAALPTFGIGIGVLIETGRLITIPSRLLNYAQVDATYCYGAVQGNGGYGLQVLGDVLFRASFVVFDGTVGAPHLEIVGKNGRGIWPAEEVLGVAVTRKLKPITWIY